MVRCVGKLDPEDPVVVGVLDVGIIGERIGKGRFAIANVTNEGESTWYEGLQLLLVYVVLGIAFFVA
jgi:hypothetical protein